jgi:hypothetical protein
MNEINTCNVNLVEIKHFLDISGHRKDVNIRDLSKLVRINSDDR